MTEEIKKLELAHAIREFHHKSLWEEEKHFTWWLSLILPAQIVIYTNGNICNPNKFILITISSLIGIFLSLIAFRVLRVEGGYFHTALKRFVCEYNHIYTTAPLSDTPQDANKSIRDLIKSFCKLQMGVRDSFQLLFLFFMLVFVGMFFFSLFTFIV